MHWDGICFSLVNALMGTENGRSMTTIRYYSVNHQSGLQSNMFSKLLYSFWYIKMCDRLWHFIWFHDDFIGQKILKLWRQESCSFGPGWAPHITSIYARGPNVFRAHGGEIIETQSFSELRPSPYFHGFREQFKY